MTFDPQALLRQVFPGMAEDARQEMARLAKVTSYPAGTMLCHEGALEEVFYIIGEGEVSVTQQLGNEERFLRSSGPGQYFGEMALIANSPRNANVRATKDSSFLEIDKPTFVEMIRQNPVIALTMFQTTVSWLRSNDSAAITALTRQKQEIENAYNELSLQEHRRSEFLTTLAHEIRTPLTTANGFMQLIQSGNMTGPALQMGLSKVGGGLERIVSLVNDLLFVQEMELIEPTVRPVDLPELIKTVAEELETPAANNDLTITVNLPEVMPKVEADPDGLIRAMRALLDNAIKFSPNGGEIVIDVVVSDDHLEVAFRDPGIGIEPEFLPKIFERFEHQEKRGDQLFGGIGLGLSIAQHLIESIGGKITVQSEVDKGSVFTVRLPVLVQNEPSSVGNADA
jgi:signal transduction histidine kinase